MSTLTGETAGKPAEEQLGLLLYCAASPEIGFGHLARCTELLRLAQIRQWEAALVLEADYGVRIAGTEGAQIFRATPGQEATDLAGNILSRLPRRTAITFDLPTRSSAPGLASYRGDLHPFVLMNATPKTADEADLAFVRETSVCPPGIKNGHAGWEYEVVRQAIRQLRPERYRRRKTFQQIAVSFGGSDPGELTEDFLKQAANVQREPLTFLLFLGSGIADDRIKAISKQVEALSNATTFVNPASFGDHLRSVDGIVIQGGQTLIEAMNIGTPVFGVTYGPIGRNILRASEEGLISLLGEPQTMVVELVRKVSETSRLNSQGTRAMEAVDGLGGERCLNRIREILAGDHADN